MDEFPIVRVWSGHVPVERGDAFHSHLLETGVADARATEGCMGVTVLRRDTDGRAVFTLLTYWRDAVAVSRFASGTGAVHYPGDEEHALVPDEVANHHALLLDWRDPGGGQG